VIELVAGRVAVRRPGHVVVETSGGVGYRLAVSAETLRQVPAAGEHVSLLAHLVVREDALSLFGFATEDERDLFGLLVSVQSVGPKMALAVLSGGSPRELVAALAAGDTARLQAVPGIGKRTAERIVVELREKVGPEAPAALGRTGPGAGGDGVGGDDDPRRLARDGLLELGYAPVEAESLLRGAAGESPEELLQDALRAARRAA
jgi:holliday junction DNA helicase RuvA